MAGPASLPVHRPEPWGVVRSRDRALVRLPTADRPGVRLSFRPAEPWPLSRGAPRSWTGDLWFDGRVAASGPADALRAWLHPGRRRRLAQVIGAYGLALWVGPSGLWARLRPLERPTPALLARLHNLALLPSDGPEPDRRFRALTGQDQVRIAHRAGLFSVLRDRGQPDWLRADALCGLWREEVEDRAGLLDEALDSGRPELVTTAFELLARRLPGAGPPPLPLPAGRLLAAARALPEPLRSACLSRLGDLTPWRGALTLDLPTPVLDGGNSVDPD